MNQFHSGTHTIYTYVASVYYYISSCLRYRSRSFLQVKTRFVSKALPHLVGMESVYIWKLYCPHWVDTGVPQSYWQQYLCTVCGNKTIDIFEDWRFWDSLWQNLKPINVIIRCGSHDFHWPCPWLVEIGRRQVFSNWIIFKQSSKLDGWA